jgi:hypothetical protein
MRDVFISRSALKGQPFNAGIKSLRAMLHAEIFLLGILILKRLNDRCLYKSFGVKGLIPTVLL